jgi:hypothetical protein
MQFTVQIVMKMPQLKVLFTLQEESNFNLDS